MKHQIEVFWGGEWIAPLSAQPCKDGSYVVEVIDRRDKRIRWIVKNPKREPFSKWRYSNPAKFVADVAQSCVKLAHAGKL